MILIPDGYTEVLTLADGGVVLHRPVPADVRKVIDELVRPLDATEGHRVLAGIARDRIVHPVGYLGPLKVEDCAKVLKSRTEKTDEANLKRGAALVKERPHLAELTCEQCRAYWYDPLLGKVNRREGKPIRRTDEPCLCELSKECPFGHWRNPKGFSAKNRMAFAHWRACRTTGHFPDDPIVARNARIIEQVMYGDSVGRGAGAAVRAGDDGRGAGGRGRSGAGRGSRTGFVRF